MNDDLHVENFSLIVVVTELMFIFAVFLNFLIFKINPVNFIHFNVKTLLIAIPITLLLTIANIFALEFLYKYVSFFKKLKEAYDHIVPMLKKITFPEVIMISLISGFAEELFFRGVIQSVFGILIGALLFGGFHVGNKKTIPYGIYAMGIGFFFGYLFHVSNNLFLPISVHILNNFIALNYMKYYYAKNY
ncbi:MAG: CPBP family intramembrane glutamic endopeptidase [bacterium]